MKTPKSLPVESLVVLSYNGHKMTVHTPGDLDGVKPRKGEYVPTPARYERPRTSEGVAYSSIADIARGGEKTVFEQGETLSAASCSFPIHDAPNFARWITPAHKMKIAEAREEIEKARAKLAKAIARAWDGGVPITPDEVRKLGEGR